MSDILEQDVSLVLPNPVIGVIQNKQKQEIVIQLASTKLTITANTKNSNLILKTSHLDYPKEKLLKVASDNNLCISNHCGGISLAAKISGREYLAGTLTSFEKAIRQF